MTTHVPSAHDAVPDQRRTETTYRDQPTGDNSSGWAAGLTTFGMVMMLVIGVLQLINGIAAIGDGEFYVDVRGYVFDIDLNAWGWVHVGLGAVLILAGLGVLAGKTWAFVLAMIMVSLSIVGNFLFLPYYPVWSLLIVALDVAVLWALSSRLGTAS